MPISRCRYWWCPKCHMVYEKKNLAALLGGDSAAAERGAKKLICGRCQTPYPAAEVYAGVHDVPASHWPRLPGPVELMSPGDGISEKATAEGSGQPRPAPV